MARNVAECLRCAPIIDGGAKALVVTEAELKRAKERVRRVISMIDLLLSERCYLGLLL